MGRRGDRQAAPQAARLDYLCASRGIGPAGLANIGARIPSLDYDREVFGEKVIRSVTANTKQDGLDLLREAAAIPIKPRTQSFPLAEANRALQELKAGRYSGAGVLVLS
jgi:alcohol dehydrogenase, propanol-preferring